MNRDVNLPPAQPLDEDTRESIERLAEGDDWVGDLARMVLERVDEGGRS